MIVCDVVDFFGEDIFDFDDDFEIMGDGDMFVDVGLGEFDMEVFVDVDEDFDEILFDIVVWVYFGL